MDNQEENDETFEPLNTLSGAFVCVVKLKRNKLTEENFLIKLSEIKCINEDLRYSNVEGSVVKTYKDVSYYCFISTKELLKIINLFIFKPEDYYEMYGI